MIKYNGNVYIVTCDDVTYAVKNNYLDEFVALHRGNGVIVIVDFVMSVIEFDYALQWYKKL